MKNLFENMINIQPGITVAIILLLAIGPLIKKNYTAKLGYMLWLIVALRMLLPFDINAGFDKKAPVNIEIQPVYVNVHRNSLTGAPAVEFIPSQIYTPPRTENLPTGITTGKTNPEYDSPKGQPQNLTAVKQKDILPTVTQLYSALWFVVSFSAIVYTTITYFISKRKILSTAIYDPQLKQLLEDIKAETGTDKKVDIAYCRYSGSPMLTGIVNPVIIIPLGCNCNLPMVIRHELCHLKHNDVLYKFLLHFLKCVYIFNPLVWVMAKKRGEDIELYCDESVIAGKNKDFKSEYAAAILQAVSKGRNTPVLSTSFSHTAKNIKQRFVNIFFDKIRKQGKTITAVFIGVVIAATTLVGCGEVALPAHKPRVYSLTNFGYADGDVSGDKLYFVAYNENGENRGKNIVVKDMSGNTGFLCNTAGCTHNDTSCTSYIDYYDSEIILLNDGNTIVYTDIVHSYKDTVPEDYRTLNRMNVDGSNRQLLYTFDPLYKDFSSYGSFAHIDNKIYLSLYNRNGVVNSDGVGKGYLQFARIDLDTGKVNKIDIDGKNEIIIVGADQQHIYYIQQSEIENLFGLFKFNVEDNSYNYLGNIPMPQGHEKINISNILHIWDNKLYAAYINGDTIKIIAYDFDNNARVETIKDSIPLNGASKFSIRDVKRGVIQLVLTHIDTQTTEITSEYIIHDMYTGYTGPLNLTIPDIIYMQPVDIVDEYEDYYIVALHGDVYMDAEGNIYTEKQPGCINITPFHFIKKYDYLTNNPIYIPLINIHEVEAE